MSGILLICQKSPGDAKCCCVNDDSIDIMSLLLLDRLFIYKHDTRFGVCTTDFTQVSVTSVTLNSSSS